MQIIVPIDDNVRRRIERIVAKDSSYYSLDDFILRAILNQVALEESGPSRLRGISRRALASQVTFPNHRPESLSDKKLRARTASEGTSIADVYPSLNLSHLSPVVAPSPRLEVPTAATDQAERSIPLWGQISRIAPGVFSLRILCNLVKERQDRWVNLESASKYISEQAVTARVALADGDEVNERARGYQLSTGFPRSDRVSQQRFTNQYVGYLAPRANRPQGLLADLCFINMQRAGDGSTEIGVTKNGFAFARLPCPLVDVALVSLGSTEAGLSEEGVDFLEKHLKDCRPGELNFLVYVLKGVAEGANTPSSLLEVTEKYLRGIDAMSSLTPAVISTHRAGATSKLVEFGALSITKKGPRSYYGITERGRSLIGGA